MFVNIVLALIVFCGVIYQTESENYDARPFMQSYTRFNRGKYNSFPQRFYSRPPMSLPVKGTYSLTPPPNQKTDDDESQYPGPPSYPRSKVSTSNRATNDGLREEDINNIVKYLSKQDLDKIIELAGGKYKYNEFPKDNFEKYDEYNKPPKNEFKYSGQDNDSGKYSLKSITEDDNKLFKTLVQEIDMGPKYSSMYQEPKPFNVEYNKPTSNFVTQPTPPAAYFGNFQNSNNLYNTAGLAAEESMLKKQIAHLQSQINDGVVYTDSEVMPEEYLPKPINLREDPDHDASYTNNVPTVVKADKHSSYKLENFGALPLMDYNSKLDTLSSYHVPHYTVTSPSMSSSPSLSPSSYSAPSSLLATSSYGAKAPPIEPAPPLSAAKSQSDAHLKAVRIWSHKSKGTAYTLHDDGTLSLEKPLRSKGNYGYS